MANANVSRLGQANAAGDPTALFLKVFAGEVLTAFNRLAAFRDKQITRTIASGKSAQFPVTGYATAGYHTPGTEILGQTLRQGEKIITIEDLLVSPAFIANIDEAMNHYDLRSVYSQEIAEALSRAYDQAVARTGILNARVTTPVIDDLTGGTTVNNAAFATDGTVLSNGIFGAGVTLDTKDIPQDGRYGFIRPTQYALIVQSGLPTDFRYNQGANPNGSYAMGNARMINNIELVKTNNLVNTDDRANAAIPAIRRADFTPTVALVQHKNAVGTVALQNVTMESAYDIRRQGTLMVGKYLVGHGGLRPEAGVELRTADPSA